MNNEQVKKQQYLYVSKGENGKPELSFIEHQDVIGKIKLDADLGRLHEALDYYDLPLEYDALSKALERSRADYMALIDRYEKLSDIAENYAEISSKLLYGSMD